MNLKKINSNTKQLSIILKNKIISKDSCFRFIFYSHFLNLFVYVCQTKGRISPDCVVSWNKLGHEEIFQKNYRNDNQKEILHRKIFSQLILKKIDQSGEFLHW